MEAPGPLRRDGEKQDGARALVGETHRPSGRGAGQRRPRHCQPRVRYQRGQEPGSGPGQAGAGRGRACRHGAAHGSGVRPAPRGVDQVHAFKGRPGRLHPAEGFDHQGRQAARGAGTEGQPAQAARRGAPPGGQRRADPARSELQTAAQGVREPDPGGGAVPHARAAPRLRRSQVRGADGLEGAGGGRAAPAVADGGETADRHGGTADDRGGARTRETRGVVDLLWCVKRAGGARSRAEEGTGTRNRDIARPGEEAGLAAPEAPTRIPQRVLPFAVLLRYRVWQRRPVSCGGFSRRTGIPDRNAHVEVARPMRLVGLGRELVDGRRVDGVLAFLRALDVPVLAAPLAEEVAGQSLAVRASPASAFCGLRGASSAATGRSTIQTFLTGARPLPVGLDRAWPFAAALATSWWFCGQDGGRDETRRELATPLGDEG